MPRPTVNPYVHLIQDYSDWVLLDKTAREVRNQWKSRVFSSSSPLDVEIGTGNGFHFANYAKSFPERSLVGFEIKYKTVVQSIARARREGCKNARMVKGDATRLSEYFAEGEVQKLMVHFPDPWPKARQQKNRLLNKSFFTEAHKVLANDGVIEFKTDHFDYFKFATQQATQSQFVMTHYTEDLHHSFKSQNNFVTQFESLFLRKGQPIFSFTLLKRN